MSNSKDFESMPSSIKHYNIPPEQVASYSDIIGDGGPRVPIDMDQPKTIVPEIPNNLKEDFELLKTCLDLHNKGSMDLLQEHITDDISQNDLFIRVYALYQYILDEAGLFEKYESIGTWISFVLLYLIYSTEDAMYSAIGNYKPGIEINFNRIFRKKAKTDNTFEFQKSKQYTNQSKIYKLNIFLSKLIPADFALLFMNVSYKKLSIPKDVKTKVDVYGLDLQFTIPVCTNIWVKFTQITEICNMTSFKLLGTQIANMANLKMHREPFCYGKRKKMAFFVFDSDKDYSFKENMQLNQFKARSNYFYTTCITNVITNKDSLGYIQFRSYSDVITLYDPKLYVTL